MTTTTWIEAGRYCEVEHTALQRRLIRSRLVADQTRQTPGSLWHRIGWLSRVRDRQILRARLRAYVSR
jgi:hypothetical protein